MASAYEENVPIPMDYVSEPSSILQSITTASPSKPDQVRISSSPRNYERHIRRKTADSDYLWSPTGTIFEEDTDKVKSGNGYYSIHRSSDASSTVIGASLQQHTNVAPPAGNTVTPQQSSSKYSGASDLFNSLSPIPPTWTRRYDGNITIGAQDQSWIIEPMSMPYLRRNNINNWRRCTHPDGQPYFEYSISPDNMRYTCRYVTDADLADGEVLDFVENLVQCMAEEFETNKTLPGQFDVVFEQLEEGWGYYMVDHSSRSIFWLHSFDASWIPSQILGLPSYEHMDQWFHYEYWSYMEQFPQPEEITDEVIDELIGILLHGSTDALTSLDSTVVYSLDECRDMLSIVKYARKIRGFDNRTKMCDPYIAVSISRILAMFCQSRFMNMYGHRGARLGREQSIRGPKELYRTFLITFLSPFLFRSPDTHLRGLERIWVDGVINQRPWKIFVDTLKEEWIEFILYATVLLNANVAFLAIPNVDSNSNELTACQFASMLSIIASLGSIIVGLLLVRQHRTKAKETAEDAAAYLSKRTHHTLGLEILAIMYSLPYALLMWGMVTFLLAIAIVCFDGTQLWQQIVFSMTWVALATLVVWTIITGWERTQPSTFESLMNWLKHCMDLVRRQRRDVETGHETMKFKGKLKGVKFWRRFSRRKFKGWHQSNASLTSISREKSLVDDR